jgi:DNA gyrase subunit A
VAKAELMTRSWDSKLVREMLTRTAPMAAWSTPTTTARMGLEKEFGMGRTACTACRHQAQEILQMRLQRLTGLEQDKIVAEYKDVMAEIEDLLDILAKPERVSAIISDELPPSSRSSARPSWARAAA